MSVLKLVESLCLDTKACAFFEEITGLKYMNILHQ